MVWLWFGGLAKLRLVLSEKCFPRVKFALFLRVRQADQNRVIYSVLFTNNTE